MEQQTAFEPKQEGFSLFRMVFLERRVSPRLDAKDGVISIEGVHVNAATTRMLDVSMQGLGFEHISPLPLPDAFLNINLLVVDKKTGKDLFFHLAKAEILSVADVHGSWGKRGGSARRYGLRFVDLSPQQLYSLGQFLGENSAKINMPISGENATH